MLLTLVGLVTTCVRELLAELTACQYARETGHTAAIGALTDIPAIGCDDKGTLINRSFVETTWHR